MEWEEYAEAVKELMCNEFDLEFYEGDYHDMRISEKETFGTLLGE